jgi:hypothetical protein
MRERITSSSAKSILRTKRACISSFPRADPLLDPFGGLFLRRSLETEAFAEYVAARYIRDHIDRGAFEQRTGSAPSLPKSHKFETRMTVSVGS